MKNRSKKHEEEIDMKKIIAIALAVLMLVGLATVAFAEDSPVAAIKHKVTIILVFPDGSTRSDGVYIVDDGDSFSYTAKVMVEGHYFTYMTVEGEWRTFMKTYSRNVSFTPTSDVLITVYYQDPSSPIEPEPVTPAPAGPADNSATSPDTGVNFAQIALAVLIGLFGVVVSVKKLFVK